MAFGMDPEVTKYFKKILNSLFAGLLWMFINITAGIYYELAYSKNYPRYVHILFFVWLALSLLLLLVYLRKTWRK
jgi:membrane protein DedA with SNARE-associated domain